MEEKMTGEIELSQIKQKAIQGVIQLTDSQCMEILEELKKRGVTFNEKWLQRNE